MRSVSPGTGERRTGENEGTFLSNRLQGAREDLERSGQRSVELPTRSLLWLRSNRTYCADCNARRDNVQTKDTGSSNSTLHRGHLFKHHSDLFAGRLAERLTGNKGGIVEIVGRASVRGTIDEARRFIHILVRDFWEDQRRRDRALTIHMPSKGTMS